MRIGSLFSGIGGFELGLEWAGVGHTVWQVEYDHNCRHWLAEHWADATRHVDVRFVGAHNLTPVDVLCGGFPCQPHSHAGLRKGKDDHRDLWPDFGRIIRELRPRFVVAENVPGLLSSDDGRYFNRVMSDLAEAGYDAEWDVLSAADVGALHLRERVFIIAWREGLADPRFRRVQCVDDARGARGERGTDEGEGLQRERGGRDAGDRSQLVCDADRGRREQRHAGLGGQAEPHARHLSLGHAERQWAVQRDGRGAVEGGRAAASPWAVVDGDADRGVGNAGSAGREEWEFSALAGHAGHAARERGGVVLWREGVAVRGCDGTVRLIPRDAAEKGPESSLWPVADGIPGRVARLKAIGNAVVPQVAEVVGRRLLEIDRELRR